MRWRQTSDGDGGVEDLRGSGGSRGGMRSPTAIGGGLGGLVLIGVIIAVILVFTGGGAGFSPDAGLDGLGATPAATGQGIDASSPDPDAHQKAFVVYVVNDVQGSWKDQFAAAGKAYPPTTLRLFTGGIRTGCGSASSSTGPFYCPADRRVYLDMAFFRELSSRFGAPGDFAQAYVIAHEFGHHVQNVLGILPQVNQEMRDNPSSANALSVKLELQADCFAGVWAHSAYTRNLLEDGDLEEGLTAAAAVGDDRIQAASGGGEHPESFTHGTSEQRKQWFLTGFQNGDVAACNTFG
jgi:predicted metalloprotease